MLVEILICFVIQCNVKIKIGTRYYNLANYGQRRLFQWIKAPSLWH